MNRCDVRVWPKADIPNSGKTTSTILRCEHNERADGCLILGKSGRRLDGAERRFLTQVLFSLVRHHAPTAGRIEVRSSKHVIGCLSGVTPALIGPWPTLVSTVRNRHGAWFHQTRPIYYWTDG
jgi:hypothetical protein